MSDADKLASLQELISDLAVIARSHDKKLNALVDVTRETVERLNALVEVAHRFDERLETLAEAQANFEVKIAALADAQITTESVVASLGVSMNQLAQQQAHTDQRLDALIDIVREGREGNPRSPES